MVNKIDREIKLCYNKKCNKNICGYNLVVECHASDLIARVRFSLPAPPEYNLRTVKVREFFRKSKNVFRETNFGDVVLKIKNYHIFI